MKLLTFGQLPYFKDYLKVSGAAFQKYSLVATSPWSMKGAFGMVSDLVPLLGYHKRWYILFSAVCGSISLLLLSLLPPVHSFSLSATAAILFAFCHFEVAIADLLVEGKYAELMNLMPYTGSDIVTWVWIVYFSFSLIAAIFVGPLADEGMYRFLFLFGIPVAAQIVLPTYLGYLPEKRLTPPDDGIQWRKYYEHQNVFHLALLTAFSAFFLAISNIMFSETQTFVLSLVLSLILSGSLFVAFPPPMAKAVLYMFLIKASYINLEGVLSYFYTSG